MLKLDRTDEIYKKMFFISIKSFIFAINIKSVLLK